MTSYMYIYIPGGSNFLEESSFNEWEHDLSLKNWPSEVNRRSVDNLMHREYGMPHFAFEEPFSPTRCLSNGYLSLFLV